MAWHWGRLNSLRAFAALHVLLLHESLDVIEGAPAQFNLLLDRTTAVGFFFLLSGMLLTYAYWDRIGAREGRRRFFEGRVARLLPLYFLGFALHLPIYLGKAFFLDFGWKEAAGTVALNLFLLQSWVPHWEWFVNRPAWTISTNVWLLALFPATLAALRRMSPRALAAAFVALLATTQLLVWLATQHLDLAGPEQEILHKFPIVRWPEFLLGCVMGAWLKAKPERTVGTGINATWLPAAAGVAAIALFIGLPAGASEYLHNGALVPLLAITLWGALFGAPGFGFLDNPFLVRLGKASYALYIVHIPVANYLSGVLYAVGLQWRFTPQFIVIDLLVLVPLSFWIHERFEEAWRVRVRGWFEARRTARLDIAS